MRDYEYRGILTTVDHVCILNTSRQESSMELSQIKIFPVIDSDLTEINAKYASDMCSGLPQLENKKKPSYSSEDHPTTTSLERRLQIK
ncbi:hypothetical protein TNCV_3365421 [Trichonephila clavipes]|nr:hypothetical protein TNCV_3365421 [Trichonephila clavipes]